MSDEASPKFKVYAVSEFNWQYDDQNHYTPEGDPSYPIRAYLSEQRAKDECLTRNMASFRGRDLGDYSSEGLHPYIEGEPVGFVEWANKTLGMKWKLEEHVFLVPTDISESKIALLMEKFSLRFYEVVAIEFDPDTSAIVEPPPPAPPAPGPVVPPNESDRTITLED